MGEAQEQEYELFAKVKWIRMSRQILRCEKMIRFNDINTAGLSVTRLVDLLHFGQLFKACGNNYFAQLALIIRQFSYRFQNIPFLVVKSFLGNFYRHLATIYCSHVHGQCYKAVSAVK